MRGATKLSVLDVQCASNVCHNLKQKGACKEIIMTISINAFFRGMFNSKEAMAFRRWFYKLSNLRSLVQNKIPFMAVTATASRQTKETIPPVLRFGNFVEVSERPNKPNICYSIQTMDKRTPLLQYFQWILNELKEKKVG